MPIMPNVVGLPFYTAQASLQAAGVLVPGSVGYFGTWPITPIWRQSSTPIYQVLSQSINAGNTVAANVPITLGVSEPKVAVIFP